MRVQLAVDELTRGALGEGLDVGVGRVAAERGDHRAMMSQGNTVGNTSRSGRGAAHPAIRRTTSSWLTTSTIALIVHRLPPQSFTVADR